VQLLVAALQVLIVPVGNGPLQVICTGSDAPSPGPGPGPGDQTLAALLANATLSAVLSNATLTALVANPTLTALVANVTSSQTASQPSSSPPLPGKTSTGTPGECLYGSFLESRRFMWMTAQCVALACLAHFLKALAAKVLSSRFYK
jgi:hypothetical protein